MLFDDLLEHLNCFAPLIRQDETSRQFLAGVCVVRLQFKNVQIKRNRLFQLLGSCIVVGDILQDRRVIAGMFGCLLENFVGPFQFVGFGL